MNVLLSVKPKYANEILSGRKTYEFRKVIFKRDDIERVFVYSSSPVNKIVASFEIEKILTASPKKIWKHCHKYAGISKKEFFIYFENSDISFAIKIKNVSEFPNPIDPYLAIDSFNPPQSFCYISSNFFNNNWHDAQSIEINKLTPLTKFVESSIATIKTNLGY